MKSKEQILSILRNWAASRTENAMRNSSEGQDKKTNWTVILLIDFPVMTCEVARERTTWHYAWDSKINLCSSSTSFTHEWFFEKQILCNFSLKSIMIEMEKSREYNRKPTGSSHHNCHPQEGEMNSRLRLTSLLFCIPGSVCAFLLWFLWFLSLLSAFNRHSRHHLIYYCLCIFSSLFSYLLSSNGSQVFDYFS